jgi:dCMP deaminase
VSRPDWDTHMMRTAYVQAMRATCLRRHVGAVLKDSEHRIVATGYNGAARHQPDCTEVGCQMIEGHCVRTLHAESNVIDYAGRMASRCTLYVTVTPCWDCAKRIINANISRVVYDEHYESRYGKSMDVPDFLRAAGVEVDRMPPEQMAAFKEAIKNLDVDPPGGIQVVSSPDVCTAHRFADDDVCVVCGLRDS